MVFGYIYPNMIVIFDRTVVNNNWNTVTKSTTNNNLLSLLNFAQ